MNKRISRLIALVGLVAGTLNISAQAPPPLLRTPNTTNIASGLPANSEVPTWDNANNRWDYQLPPGAGGGEANTASTLGASGSGLYVQKVGVDLEFNSIAAGLGLTIASNAYVLTFTPTVQYQQTNGNLTLLQAYGPATWQATNANLTLLQAYGPTTWQATNANLTGWAAIVPFNTNINYGSANGYVVTNQFVSLGAARAATLTLNDDAYAAGWDGSTNVPTKNAIYDKIQTLGSAATNIDYGSANTYSITNLLRSFGTANAATLTVNDDAYAAGWDGSTNVPTKNSLYDKIQTLGSAATNIDYGSANTYSITNLLRSFGSANLASATVNDDAYAAGWDGSTNVPTKNALYDKIQTLGIATTNFDAVSANGMVVSNQLEVLGTLLISGTGTNSLDSLWATNYVWASNVIAKVVMVDDDAYAAGWDGSTNVPTKNALYDKIQTITGATNIDYGSANTYSVTNLLRSFGTANAATLTVNDDAYAAGWDGSTNVPTKNAVYDKIQTLGSAATNIDYGSANGYTVTNLLINYGTTTLGTATVNDDAYAVGWNGSTNVPTKNALYDKINTLVTSGTIIGSIGVTADGSGTAVAAGVKGYAVVPYSGHITGWSIVANGASPTNQWDVWKVASGTTLPTVAETITGSQKPYVNSGNAARSIAINTWGAGTNLTAGDIIGFNYDAGTVGTRVTLTLETLR